MIAGTALAFSLGMAIPVYLPLARDVTAWGRGDPKDQGSKENLRITFSFELTFGITKGRG